MKIYVIQIVLLVSYAPSSAFFVDHHLRGCSVLKRWMKWVISQVMFAFQSGEMWRNNLMGVRGRKKPGRWIGRKSTCFYFWIFAAICIVRTPEMISQTKLDMPGLRKHHQALFLCLICTYYWKGSRCRSLMEFNGCLKFVISWECTQVSVHWGEYRHSSRKSRELEEAGQE